MNTRWKPVALCIALVGLVLLPGCASLVDYIPPRDMTFTSMDETLVRIDMYMKEHHGEPPPNLAVLPVRQGYMNRTTDGWGYELQYSVDAAGVITLASHGADGKPGGDGLNADIVRRYRTRNPDGSSCVDDEYWITNAEIRQR